MRPSLPIQGVDGLFMDHLRPILGLFQGLSQGILEGGENISGFFGIQGTFRQIQGSIFGLLGPLQQSWAGASQVSPCNFSCIHYWEKVP